MNTTIVVLIAVATSYTRPSHTAVCVAIGKGCKKSYVGRPGYDAIGEGLLTTSIYYIAIENERSPSLQ